MTSSPSPLLRTEQQETGDNVNAWGVRLNAAILRLEEAIAGAKSIALSGNYTLSTVNYETDEARLAVLQFTDGGLSAAPTITIPAVSKLYHVVNLTGYALTFTAGGVTGTVDIGRQATVISMGVDILVYEPVAEVEAAFTAAKDAAAASALAAATSAAAAATSESNASASETSAGTSETNAAASAAAAATSATASQDAQTASEAARDSASGHRLDAQNAQTAAETAQAAAETAETNAETAETNAGTSAAAASTSASSATTSETNAASSASDAATSETNAADSAAAAAQSAANAAGNDPYIASSVITEPATTGLSATNVEAGLAELNAEKLAEAVAADLLAGTATNKAVTPGAVKDAYDPQALTIAEGTTVTFNGASRAVKHYTNNATTTFTLALPTGLVQGVVYYAVFVNTTPGITLGLASGWYAAGGAPPALDNARDVLLIWEDHDGNPNIAPGPSGMAAV